VSPEPLPQALKTNTDAAKTVATPLLDNTLDNKELWLIALLKKFKRKFRPQNYSSARMFRMRFVIDTGAAGADEKNRTPDLRITNALLYQLSYIGNVARLAL
jgi:hypothetical protein